MLRLGAPILIVDDAEGSRHLICEILERLRFTNLVQVEDGEAGWEEIQRGIRRGTPFELIISDWEMPGIDGVDLLKLVRSEPRIKATPFIMLTANASKDLILRAIAEGVSGYLTKPFAPGALAKKLEEVAPPIPAKQARSR